ncbi:MAG: hypothetical protein KKC54_04110, partial [Nanoarchaeota archaeon]|nr:hypothetical protein [Nanoarchaeota archaeon]
MKSELEIEFGRAGEISWKFSFSDPANRLTPCYLLCQLRANIERITAAEISGFFQDLHLFTEVVCLRSSGKLRPKSFKFSLEHQKRVQSGLS